MKKLIFKTILVSGLFILLNGSVFSQTGWYQQVSNTNNTLYSVQFLDNNTGYACGNSGIILKTTNGGVNWNIVFFAGSGYKFYSLCIINANTCYAGGAISNGGIYNKTTNAGNNWTIYGSVTLKPIFS